MCMGGGYTSSAEAEAPECGALLPLVHKHSTFSNSESVLFSFKFDKGSNELLRRSVSLRLKAGDVKVIESRRPPTLTTTGS